MSKERGILYRTAMIRAKRAGFKNQTRRLVKPQPPIHCSGPATRSLTVNDAWNFGWAEDHPAKLSNFPMVCPYGKVGDRLFGRESIRFLPEWNAYSPSESDEPIHYEADSEPAGGRQFGKLRPGIHMPRQFCRILDEITEIRVQRLQDISPEDAIAEGIDRTLNRDPKQNVYRDYTFEKFANDPSEWLNDPRESFRTMWDSHNTKPRPVYEGRGKSRKLVGYIAYSWSDESFDQLYPGKRGGLWRGLPLEVVSNPWVWAITTKAVNP